MKLSMESRTLALAMALGVASLPTSTARAETNWDYYTFLALTHPVAKVQLEFTKEVEARTNGELKIILRPQGELPYSATEVPQVTGQGQVHMGSAYSGFIGGVVPLANLTGLPFLVRTPEEAEEIRAIIDQYMKVEFEKLGTKVLFNYFAGAQGVFGKGEPIKSVEDFAGRKIRLADANQATFFGHLGATGVSIVAAEVAVAMDRGVMDSFVTTPGALIGNVWQELVQWYWDGKINLGGPFYELVNLEAYNALAPEVRATLDKVADEFEVSAQATVFANEERQWADLAKYNIAIVEASPEMVDKLIAEAVPLWEEWAKQQGPTAMAMLKDIRAVLNK